MRKTITVLFVITILLTFVTCEKDEILEKCDKCLPIYFVYVNNDTISFTYNDNYQIIKINSATTYSPRTETFEYNANNQMVQYNLFMNDKQDSYIKYEYSGNNLISSTEYRNTDNYDNLEDYEAYSPIIYECDDEGKIVKLIRGDYYIKYKYDSRGNEIENEQYKFNYMTGTSELYIKTTFEYGSNYFFNKDLGLPINIHSKVLNNLTKLGTNYYNETGEIINTSVLEIQYHSFNVYGYPTSLTKTYLNTNNSNTYKTIEYLVIK